MTQQSKNSAALGFTLAQVNAAIESLSKAQQRTHDQISRVLVMATFASIVGIEAGKNRDHVGVAQSLVNVLRTSMKKDAIVAFLMHFGALNYSAKEGFKHFTLGAAGKLVWSKEYVDTVQAAARNWETFRVAPAEKEYDVAQAVTGILTTVASRQKNGKVVKNDKLAAELVSALARYNAAISAGIPA